MIAPYCPSVKLAIEEMAVGGQKVQEPTVEAVDQFLSTARQAQLRLARVPVGDRLDVFDRLGRLWYEQVSAGRYDDLKTAMALSTGYSEALLETEMTFVAAVLGRTNLEENIEVSLRGGTAALEGFVDVGELEYYHHRPAGPTLIVASGNSIVPVLIPTVLSLVTGNVTFLKPSLANYEGVHAVLSLLDVLPSSDARDAIRDALCVAYLRSDGPALDHALAGAAFGVVNFWGGEPARGLVAQKVAKNPHRPRFFANGPMTGVAMVHAQAASEDAADGLALNMVLYDQQLCSSPTCAVFVGDHPAALEFARRTAGYLDENGSAQPMKVEEGVLFSLQNFRRTLQVRGGTVLAGRSQDNAWTICVSKKAGVLDLALAQYPHMGLHARRRFLELVSVPTVEEALEIIRTLPQQKAYAGIDRVQTVGLAVPEGMEDEVSQRLAEVGVFRILPVGDMYMRSSLEPYDGVVMASLFTYIAYRRARGIDLEDQL